MTSSDPRGIFELEDPSPYLSRAAEVTVERIADGIWTVSEGDYRALFAEGDDGVVAFNTLATPAAARGFREAVARTLPGREISTVVYTIDHLDHSGWSSVLAPDATVVAHEFSARVVSGRGSEGQAPVDRAVAGTGEEMTLDGVSVRLDYHGPSQGTGNLAVTFPDRGVTFLVGPRVDARYGLLSDFHFRHATDVWRAVASAAEGDVIVPGRGGLMTPPQLERAADYLDALAEASQRAFAEGQPIWIIEAMEPYCAEALRSDFGELDGFADHIGIGSIRLVHYYLMGGWGLEDSSVVDRLLAG